MTRRFSGDTNRRLRDPTCDRYFQLAVTSLFESAVLYMYNAAINRDSNILRLVEINLILTMRQPEVSN